MTPEQKQRIEQIESGDQEWRKTAYELGDVLAGHEGDVDFLLSLVKSQEAEILKTLDDAVIRVGASANCYDVPADANSGAEYVAMRVRQVIAPNSNEKPLTRPSDDVKRFYFIDSHGDEAFIHEADYNRVAISMRSACVEKVKARARHHFATAKMIDGGEVPDVPMRSEEYRRLADELNTAAKELESLSIEQPKE